MIWYKSVIKRAGLLFHSVHPAEILEPVICILYFAPCYARDSVNDMIPNDIYLALRIQQLYGSQKPLVQPPCLSFTSYSSRPRVRPFLGGGVRCT